MHAERLREDAVQHAVRPLLGQLPQARRRTGSSPSCLRSLRSLWHYHHDVYAFHTSVPRRRDARLPVEAAGLADPQPPGRRRGRARHQARPAGLRRAPPDSTCLRQVLLLGTPGAVVGRRARAGLRGLRLDRQAGLAVRRRGRRCAGVVAAVDPQRRPADLLLLRDRDHPVHGDRDRALHRHDDGRPRRPRTRRRMVGYGGRRRVRRAGHRELRVVLADLHRRS